MPTTVKSEAMKEAILLCDHVRGCRPDVEEAYLFGSVAREGDGNDIDLFFVVSEELATAFAVAVNYRRSFLHFAYHKAEQRREIALCILNIQDDLVTWSSLLGIDKPMPLDIFLFPPNWRGRLEYLEDCFPSDDGFFIRRIAAEAKRFISLQDTNGEFQGFIPQDK